MSRSIVKMLITKSRIASIVIIKSGSPNVLLYGSKRMSFNSGIWKLASELLMVWSFIVLWIEVKLVNQSSMDQRFCIWNISTRNDMKPKYRQEILTSLLEKEKLFCFDHHTTPKQIWMKSLLQCTRHSYTSILMPKGSENKKWKSSDARNRSY